MTKFTKIGHYLRYDVSGLEFFLKCNVKNIFDTKIASKFMPNLLSITWPERSCDGIL